MSRSGFLFYIILICPIVALSTTPDWATKSTFIKSGNQIVIVCFGAAGEIGAARSIALNGCRESIGNFLTKEYQIKTLAIESEKESTLHHEVTTNYKVENLQCKMLDEAVEYETSEVKVWQKCQFNLEEVIIKTENSEALGTQQPLLQTNVSPPKIAERQTAFQQNERTVVISSIPACEKIIAETNGFHFAHNCKSNPTLIKVPGKDLQITIRAKGFIPKVFVLKKGVKSVDVLLDPSF